jgi:hypothetical protein
VRSRPHRGGCATPTERPGHVTNDPTGWDGLSPKAVEAQAVLGGPFAVVADVGYDHGQEVKQCLHVGMTPYIARPITSANQQPGRFSKDDFTDAAGAAPKGCPAGAVLSGRVAPIRSRLRALDNPLSSGKSLCSWGNFGTIQPARLIGEKVVHQLCW